VPESHVAFNTDPHHYTDSDSKHARCFMSATIFDGIVLTASAKS